MNHQNIDFLRAERLSSDALTWASLDILGLDAKRIAAHRIVTFDRLDPAYLAFDLMRTKTLKSARQDKWRSLGITSPTSGCGKATVAVNLAISLAKQHDVRVALVDLDLRRPRIAHILGYAPEYGTADFLSANCTIADFFVRIGDNLAVGASPHSVPYPAELLHSEGTAQALKHVQDYLAPDIVICNLPPMLVGDDCLGLLPQVDIAMLVVGADLSTVTEIDVCERQLSEESKLLGVVLNKCRHKVEQY